MSENFILSSDEKLKNEEVWRVERWMQPNPKYLSETSTVKEAAEQLIELNAECLPVVNRNHYPVGVVTAVHLLNTFYAGEADESLGEKITSKNPEVIHVNNTIFEVEALPGEHFSVVNSKNQLEGMISRSDISKGLSAYIEQMTEHEHTAEILNEILESAYEGVAVVNENGIVQEFNEAYSRFTGIGQQDAIGKHVKEVIDNTQLPETLKTGMPERGVIQYIQGQAMIVHRIPIWKNDQVVGAIGMLIFEGVTEVYRIYERLQAVSLSKQDSQSLTPKEISHNTVTSLDQIIGNSEGTSNIKRLARKVARTNATVLITGESGTGKEMYARGIHQLSALSTGPFISVNCGAIPEHLFESELFGYEEGAFTGARKGGKPGKFEMAANGTLFLDEIGEMPLMMQTKLLRVLQEKEVGRVGGVQEQAVEMRIIAATNKDLQKMVADGEFREDLYYRINVIEMPIPPLRERSEDIPELVSSYLNAICTRHGMKEKTLTSEAMANFIHYKWPGNIRELINTLEKLVVLVDKDIIDSADLPEFMTNQLNFQTEQAGTHGLIDQAKILGSEREKELIRSMLRKTAGNKSQAAKQLGIHRTTLYQKLKKYHLNEV
ncbi:sigma 54-interacting transcriptional regulator [Halobacillus andaensis]|uniref:sigma 54-interacting transcriptional regulator n=1 Tax=Halobacillus andaensis TaxID=1176239 RepID=UPI003D71C239